MALTFGNQPDTIQAAYGYPVFYTLTSTNVLQDNFNFIADVYINGSATKAVRHRFPPNPDNNYGYIDVASVIQDYLTRDVDLNATTFQACSGSIVHFAVQFGEEYGPSSGITQYPNIQQKTGYATNAVRDYIQSNRVKDWNLLGTSLSQFLTNQPRTPYPIVKADEPFYLYALTNTFQQAYYMVITASDINDTELNYVKIINPYNGITNTSSRMIRMRVDYTYLNTIASGALHTGTAPIIPANTEYYSVKFHNIADVEVSELFYIRKESKCSKQTPVRFVFQNKLGGYDAFTFYGSNGQGSNIERSFYKKKLGEWGNESYGYSNSSRGSTQYNTVAKDTLFANSDWITADQSTWLQELVESPDVYVWNLNQDTEDYELLPVTLKDSRYDIKTLEVDQLFNLRIEYEYSFNRVRQRR